MRIASKQYNNVIATLGKKFSNLKDRVVTIIDKRSGKSFVFRYLFDCLYRPIGVFKGYFTNDMDVYPHYEFFELLIYEGDLYKSTYKD